MNILSSKRIAVLIDAENMFPLYARAIFSKASSYGDVIVRRAYGYERSFLQWKQKVFEHAIEFKLCPHQVSGKGVTDMAMAIDAMDLMNRKIVDEICLASSDSDFSMLAMRLRERGMKVYGIGKSSVVDSFVQACDEFHKLDTKSDSSVQTCDDFHKSGKEEAISKMFELACENLQGDGEGWINLANVGAYLRRINPEFKPPQKLFNLVQLVDFLDSKKEKNNAGGPVAFIRKKESPNIDGDSS